MRPFCETGPNPLLGVQSLLERHTCLVIGGLHGLPAVRDKIERLLPSARFLVLREQKTGREIANEIVSKYSDVNLIIGVGGCSRLDFIKLAANLRKIPLVLYPSLFSTDGISSKFCSIRSCRGTPESLPTTQVYGVLIDLELISRTDDRFLRSGISDVISNITAYKSASSGTAAQEARNVGIRAQDLVLKKSSLTRRESVEMIFNSGVSVSEEKNTQPISGFEHNILHCLTFRGYSRSFLHGELLGPATVLTAVLQKQNWRSIVQALRKLQIPILPQEIGCSLETWNLVVQEARNIRPERLSGISPEYSSKIDLAKDLMLINEEIKIFDSSLINNTKVIFI